MRLSPANFRVRPLTGILFFGFIVLSGLVAFGQDSPLTTAPFRLRIERNSGSPWPANVGVADIAPCWIGPSRFGVFTADGKPVAHQILWSAPGEMTRIRFDTSAGAEMYYVCFDTNLPSVAGGWKPEAGVVLETRPCASDLPMDTMPQITRLLEAAGPPAGRDYVPDIFSGLNPFGPTRYYVAIFSGWFAAPKTGEYTFATISDNASYLEVDGHMLAQWLGTHGPHGGRHGEHGGVIRLQQGVHHIDYVQIQLDGAAAAVAAWKPPGQDRPEVIPSYAFPPVARFHVAQFDTGPAVPRQFYFEWQTIDHCALADSVAVRVRFRVVDNAPARNYRWRFDDGDESSGSTTRHFFPQTGPRQVALEVSDNGIGVATNSVRVHIMPDWSQHDGWRDDVFEAAKKDFLRRDFALTPARDLEGILELAERADDIALSTHIGEVFVKRQDEFNNSAYGVTFYRIGVNFQHQGDWGDALAEKAFRLALSPQRSVMTISDKIKLRLANLLIHYSGELDEAEKLLAGISGNDLTADEKRLEKLVRGDLLLARGKIEDARKQYAAVRGPAGNALFDVAPAARLESASILLERGEMDDAQQALDSLRFVFPMERMALDSGLLDINLALKRKEFQRAFTGCRTLLPLADGDPRQSDILYALVQSSLALGRSGDAQRAVGQLLKDFPYSEAAAKAKDLLNKP
jgi:tetratricopeptide (TPR) repeat protein